MGIIDIKEINENEIIEPHALDHKFKNNNLYEFNKYNIKEIEYYLKINEDKNNQNKNN